MHQPPKWSNKLLEWYCRAEVLEDLQGDLYEFFDRNIETKGLKMARFIYVLDVLKFFRIYTVKKLKIPIKMNFFYLWKNYLKTSLRSISRNRLFSAINVVGLSVSMSVGVLLVVLLSELSGFDKFHKDGERIYRIANSYWDHEDGLGEIRYASTSPVVGYELIEKSPDVEDVTIFRRYFGANLNSGKKTLPVRGHWVNENFLSLFTFPLLKGNPETALKEPNSIVLTQTMSENLFGEEDPMGKMLEVGGYWKVGSLKVTGVVEDPPHASHLQFQCLVSFSTFEKIENERSTSNSVNQWSQMWMTHVYFRLGENSEIASVKTFLDTLNEEKNKDNEYNKYLAGLQHLHDILPGEDMYNQVGDSMDINFIYVLIVLAFIVLLSASFNYTNLSIARSLRRAKEVGIRKVVGASRYQVFVQFIFEAVILSTIALVFALGLFYVIKPYFVTYIGEGNPFLNLEFKTWYLIPIVVFAISIGFISGFLPSSFLSRVKVLAAIKDPSKIKMFSGLTLRRALIVFQFTLSIAFIVGTTICFRQYQFAVNYDLGFNTENILNINSKGNDTEILKEEFLKIPGVEAVSRSGMVLSTGSIWGETMKFEDPDDSANVHYNPIDENYLAVHDIPLLAGTNIRPKAEDSEIHQIIISEKVLERFKMGTPEEAVGKKMQLSNKREAVVVGVIPSIRHLTIQGELKPFILYQHDENIQMLNLKVKTADMLGLMSRLEEEWKKIDPVRTFDANFYEDQLKKSYSYYDMIMKIIGFLSIVAISIASLGLLGMAVYTTETRIKEISIRKILGATEKGLLVLLSRNFVFLVILASFIAVPLTYFLIENFVLSDFAERVSIGFLDVSPGVLFTMILAILTIGWQTLKAARTNPADTLRNE